MWGASQSGKSDPEILSLGKKDKDADNNEEAKIPPSNEDYLNKEEEETAKDKVDDTPRAEENKGEQESTARQG